MFPSTKHAQLWPLSKVHPSLQSQAEALPEKISEPLAQIFAPATVAAAAAAAAAPERW